MPLPARLPKQPTAAFAELEALRTSKQRELRSAGAVVPAVALQQFLVLLQAKKFEKAKALAFRSELEPRPILTCDRYFLRRSPPCRLPL